jgi:hypothetical protein
VEPLSLRRIPRSPERLRPQTLDLVGPPWLLPAVRHPVGAVFAVFLLLSSSGSRAAPKSPRADARAALGQLEAKKEDAVVAAEPIAEARKALTRARSARQAGDDSGATLLDRLAREWAEVAVALLKAVEAERRADEAERRLEEVETKTVRARALLEETVARRGRTKQELQRIESAPPPPTPAPAVPGERKKKP